MPTELDTVSTEGSMTHSGAPMLMIVEDAWFMTPLNIEVTNIMRKTANVIPSSKCRKLGLVIDEQFVGEFEDSRHGRLFRVVGWSSGGQSPEVLITLVK